MKKAFLFLALTLILLMSPSSAFAVEDWQIQPIPLDVESGVICTLDGCMKVLSNCDSAAGDQLRGEIREKMFKDGMNKDQVYTYLSQKYGENILASPSKKGFNLVAWITPFLATAGGIAAVYLGLTKWVIPARKNEKNAKSDPIDAEYQDKLNKELKKYL